MERGDRTLIGDAVRTVFRGVWKVAFVLVVTVAILAAIGWAIQSLGGDGAPPGQTATTVDE